MHGRQRIYEGTTEVQKAVIAAALDPRRAKAAERHASATTTIGRPST